MRTGGVRGEGAGPGPSTSASGVALPADSISCGPRARGARRVRAFPACTGPGEAGRRGWPAAARGQRSVPQDLERQRAHIGIMVEFSTALMSKLDGINRHSFNSFRLRVGEARGGPAPLRALEPPD